MNKSAKELFEEMGYYQIANDEEKNIYAYDTKAYSEYFSYSKYIIFFKENKQIILESSIDTGFNITMEELQAINKQVEEIEWNK